MTTGRVTQLVGEKMVGGPPRTAGITQLVGEKMVSGLPRTAGITQLVAEAMYCSDLRTCDLILRTVKCERVVLESPLADSYDVMIREVGVERIVRQYPDMRGWGILNREKFIPFIDLGFYITSYDGADAARFNLDSWTRTRSGEIPNGEYYTPREITLSGRIIGTCRSDLLQKTERLMGLLRPSSHADALGYSNLIILVYFGPKFYIIIPCKLSGAIALPMEAEFECIRDISLTFVAQSWPFMLRYEPQISTIPSLYCNTLNTYNGALFGIDIKSGDDVTFGIPVIPNNTYVTAGLVTNSYVFMAGNYGTLFGEPGLGYLSYYDTNAGAWHSFTRSLPPEVVNTLKSVTCVSARTDKYVFVGSSGGNHYAALNLDKRDASIVTDTESPGAPVLSICTTAHYGTPMVVLSGGEIKLRDIYHGTWVNRGAIPGARFIAAAVNDVYVATTDSVYYYDPEGTWTKIHTVSKSTGGAIINGMAAYGDAVVVYGVFDNVDGVAVNNIFATVVGDIDTLGGGCGENIVSATYSAGAGLVVCGRLNYAVDDPGGAFVWGIMRYSGRRWLPHIFAISKSSDVSRLMVSASDDSIVLFNANAVPFNRGVTVDVENNGDVTPFAFVVYAETDLWLPVITNGTTGQTIVFEERMLTGGEVMTLDTATMTATSNASNRPSIKIAAVSHDGMSLRRGKNRLRVYGCGYGQANIIFHQTIDSIGAAE